MIRSLTLALALPTLHAVSSAGREQAEVCGGVARAEPLGGRGFRAVRDSVAAGWNEARNYHGIALVQLDARLIRSWREYQYGSDQPWEAFAGASR